MASCGIRATVVLNILNSTSENGGFWGLTWGGWVGGVVCEQFQDFLEHFTHTPSVLLICRGGVMYQTKLSLSVSCTYQSSVDKLKSESR